MKLRELTRRALVTEVSDAPVRRFIPEFAATMKTAVNQAKR